MSTSKGRGAAAHTIAEVVPPEQLRFLFLRPRPNHAIEFDPEGTDADPAALRRVRQVRGGDSGTRGPWRAAAGIRGDLPLFAGRPERRRRRRGRRVSPAVRASGDAHPGARASTSFGRVEPEKGSAADRPRTRAPRRTRSQPRAWLEARTLRIGGPAVQWTASRRPPPNSTTSQRRFLAGSPSAAARGAGPSGDAWQTLIFSSRPTKAVPAERAFEAIYRAFLDRTERSAGGLAARQSRSAFVIGRAAEAGGLAGAVQ